MSLVSQDSAATKHQADLFSETAPAKQPRRIIQGRVKFFPKTDKQPESTEPVPFDDDISDIGF